MQRLGPKRKLIFGSLAGIAVLGNTLLFFLPKVRTTVLKNACHIRIICHIALNSV